VEDHEKLRTPWLLILKSGSVWAMVTAMVTVAYGMTVVFSYLPKYMNDVYKLNTSEVIVYYTVQDTN
jgi:predicted MFS family arabinose efflux permease